MDFLKFLGAIVMIGLFLREIKRWANDGPKSDPVTTINFPTTMPNQLPPVLYHGTPNLRSAKDIVANNRWRIFDHSPLGIYMAQDFQTAVGYAQKKGVVIEISVSLPNNLVIDISKVQVTSQQLLTSGYRLIRNANIFIAPLPNATSGYYTVEGLIPRRIFDVRGKLIQA